MKERLAWPDAAKGIGIILVVMGHSGISGIPEIWFTSFYMPLFFMLSGYFMNESDGKYLEFIKKRTYSLLFPYLFFSLLLIIFKTARAYMISDRFDIFTALYSIIVPVSGRTGGTVYELWYLPCLYLAQVAVGAYMNIKSKFTGSLLSIAIITIYASVGACLGSPSVFAAAPLAAVFMVCGIILKQVDFIKFSTKRIILTLSVLWACNLACTALNETVADMSGMSVGNPALYFCGGVTGSAGVFMTCRYIDNIKPLAFIGRNSLVCYCTHFMIMPAVSLLVDVFFPGITESLFVSAVTLALLFPTVWLYNKTGIPRLFVYTPKKEVQL